MWIISWCCAWSWPSHETTQLPLIIYISADFPFAKLDPISSYPEAWEDRKLRWGKDRSRAVILLNHLANNFTKWMFQQLTILMLLLFFCVSLELNSHPGVQGNLALCYSTPNCSFRPISVWIKLRDLVNKIHIYFFRDPACIEGCFAFK